MKYFRDCQEALKKGVACSGVYTIKPDHLPPFEVNAFLDTSVQYPHMLHETSKLGVRSATADSCFGLIGTRQCSVAQGGPATSTVDP